jgi:hypothetical protein
MQFNKPTSTQKIKTKNMTTLHLRKSSGRSPWRRGCLLIVVGLAWFALSPTLQAVTPAPDGGYPLDNTAEGTDALFSLTTGQNNTAIGTEALKSVTTGISNTAVGVQTLLHNTADLNTAIGFEALTSNTTGSDNTATGYSALLFNRTGTVNTANGFEALYGNTTGSSNTATGAGALNSNTTGSQNTANGSGALASNTIKSNNTATGSNALESNTVGDINTANGASALSGNTDGRANTANGFRALALNFTGSNNTATGSFALEGNTIGSENTANGVTALNQNVTGSNNTADGWQALFFNTTGSFNIAIGTSAGSNLTTGSNNIDIGNAGVAADARTIRIGTVGTQAKAFIAGVDGVNEGGTISTVTINSHGQLGTQPPPSSRRFKKEIRLMDKVSEAVLALKPVTFQFKSDSKGTPQFGLIAEEVANVNPDLVVRDGNGEIYSVRYDAVNAMLLNEFLKEHRTIQAQQKEIDALRAELKEQRALIQKVNDKVELSRPAPETVLNNR